MTTPLIVVQPVQVITAMLISTDVPETAPAIYSGGATYALNDQVSVAGSGGLMTVYRSLQAGNIGHTPSSSPLWWVVVNTVYAAYSGAATYALGDRAQDNTAHLIYESIQAGNIGHALTDAAYWIEVGPTNAWKVFDTSNSTQTAQASSMSYTIRPASSINSFAALNVTGATSIRVRLTHPSYGTVYDKTTDLASIPAEPGWWQWFFGTRTAPPLMVATDLPGLPGCDLVVDFVGTVDLAVGVLLFGQMRSIGLGVRMGARVGIQDYSRKETNDFGDTVLVLRAFAKRASFDIPIASEQVDAAIEYLSTVRATPCLWIGSNLYASTVVFGFYKDFDVNIAYRNVSECSLNIEGLT